MEEEDTCRICRSGPEEDTPLYHPCKCSGSIAKVHQDCLIDWLQHSKKKSCELCNTELRFHKVYSPTMPEKLPIHLYVRRFLIQFLFAIRFSLRAVFVAAAWLAILPLMNLGIWRLHFVIVDVIVWSFIGGTPPAHRLASLNATAAYANTTQPSNTSILASIASNSSSAAAAAAASASSSNGSLFNMTSSTVATFTFGNPFPLLLVDKVTIRILRSDQFMKALEKLGHDVFEGQILTCAVVVCFVAIFLLREWCLQNMPQHIEGLEGLAFAGEPVAPAAPAADPPALPAEIAQLPPLQETLDERGDDEGESRLNSLGSTGEGSSTPVGEPTNQPMRPPLTNIVPDPPEYFNDHEVGDEKEHPLEELRKLRAEKFGNMAGNMAREGDQDWWHDVDEESPEEKEKGKGKASVLDDMSSVDAEASAEGSSRAGIVDSSRPAENAEGASSSRGDSIDPLLDSQRDVQDATEDAQMEVNDERVPAPAAPEAPIAVEEEVGGGVIDARDWEDEADGPDRLEDDLEGVMEAIGMRGPLFNLLTNLLMMFVLCSFVLMIAVAVPYLIGRLLGVGNNLVRLITLPIRGMRLVTDPIIDFVIEHSLRLMRKSLNYAGVKVSTEYVVAANSTQSGVSSLADTLLRQPASFVSAMTGREHKRTVSVVSGPIAHWREAATASFHSLGPNLDAFYHRSISSLQDLYTQLQTKTQGKTQRDKIFCIVLGHLYWLVGLFVQQRLSKVYVRLNLRWLKTSVEQQLVVLKVLAFICLELIVFPWCCGFLLDMALLPLWNGVTPALRWTLMQRKPFSLSFTQWALGTLYMFSLAMFASTTRSVVRPGVLCFVRDAGDPTFHPIKDILDRRSLEQLRKIGLSGAIYSGIMLATFGFSAMAIRLTNPYTHILPLRWEMHQSLSTTGVELLFTALVMPPLIKAWLPVHVLRKAFKNWWKMAARRLRISSYLIGGRHADEEGRLVRSTLKAKLLRQSVEGSNGSVTFVKDGGFARVPADDHAIMSTPIVIYCDEKGKPLTERGKEAVKAQTEAIDKMARKPQYTVIYLPSHFQRRIIGLLAMLWATTCFCFLTILLAPLLVGRLTTALILPLAERPLHDGYSWTFGALLLGAAVQLYKTARRLNKSNNPRRRLQKIARRAGEYIWMVTSVSILSILLGVCTELYINGLSRVAFTSEPATMPDVSITHAWAMGLLLHQIVVQGIELQPGAVDDWDKVPFNRLAGFFVLWELRGPQFRRPKVWHLTKKGFLPAVLYYIAVIAAPLLVLLGLQSFFGKPSRREDANMQIHLVYLCCLLWMASPTSLIARVADRWTALIRDEHFLISTELKNYPSSSSRRGSKDEQADKSLAVLAQANGGDVHGDGNDALHGLPAAEGPIPDALLHP